MTKSPGNPHLATDEDLDHLRERLQALQQRQPDYPVQFSLLSRLSVLLEKRVIEAANLVLKPHGISYSMYHAMVLAYANCDRPLTPTELARATGERTTNITHICDELARRELITRHQDPRDRRRVVIELTEAGQALLRQLQKPIWALWTSRYDDFDAQQLAELEQTLITQLTNLDALIARVSGQNA